MKTNSNNTIHMLKVVNQDAVFAQLEIITRGTCYDEGVKLFHINSNGEKVGEHNYDLDFEDLFATAKDLMKERKLNLSEKKCGEFIGFVIKVVYDDGARSHFEITADGQVSAEYSEWKGHNIN